MFQMFNLTAFELKKSERGKKRERVIQLKTSHIHTVTCFNVTINSIQLPRYIQFWYITHTKTNFKQCSS